EALSAIRPAPAAPIYAFDRDAEAVEATRRNAGRAGFLPHLTVARATLGEGPAPEDRGLLVVNPPYGRRLAADPGRDLRRALRAAYGGLRVAVLAPAGRAPSLGRRATTHPLTNGGVRVQLAISDPPP